MHGTILAPCRSFVKAVFSIFKQVVATFANQDAAQKVFWDLDGRSQGERNEETDNVTRH